MRAIEFRGKWNGNWVYGDLIQFYEEGSTGIMPQFDGFDDAFEHAYPIDRKTLGQYTGLKDRHGWEIYEGDILRCTDASDEMSITDSDTGFGVVEWNVQWGYWKISKIENLLGDIIRNGHAEVIGNIYDNPGMLKG